MGYLDEQLRLRYKSLIEVNVICSAVLAPLGVGPNKKAVVIPEV